MDVESIWRNLLPILFSFLYLTALVLALVFYRRAPAACSLVLAASVVNLIVAIARMGMQFFWRPFDANFEAWGLVMAGLGMVNWVAYGLMIAAVFVGRQPPESHRLLRRDPRDRDDDDWRRPLAPPPPKVTDSTGIQDRPT